MIIVVVGIDGAGKTTAGRMLAQQLNAAGHPATFTTNPSGRRSLAQWAERHNFHPPLLLLETTETAIRCVNVLISHCRAKIYTKTVIMDRHLYCQVALRRVRGLRPGWILPFLSKMLPTAEIVFYFAVPIDIAHARIKGRATDTETLAHLQAFDAAYRDLEDFPSFIVINANVTSDQVVTDMLQKLGPYGL